MPGGVPAPLDGRLSPSSVKLETEGTVDEMTSGTSPLDAVRLRDLLGSRHRDAAVLDGDTWRFTRPNANLLVAVGPNDVFVVRGKWRGATSETKHFHTLREVITESNATRAFPKAYFWPLPLPGYYSVVAETALSTSTGLTEHQFYHFFEVAYQAVASFFDDLDQQVPELVTWRGGTDG